MGEMVLDLSEVATRVREERAENNPLQVSMLDEEHYPFTDYDVVGGTGIHYYVEIRSLDEKINACSCPDFHVNTLGTCKHIEGVLFFIKRKGKMREGNLRTEIFLDVKKQKVVVRYSSNEDSLKGMIDPFFSANQILLADPTVGLPMVKKALEHLPNRDVRISAYLKEWVEGQKIVGESERDKALFLSDVAVGKRSLQMLSAKLFPYQEEGMLHLAFKRRAILADEMGLGKTIQAIAAAELLRRLGRVKRVIVVSPASLKGEWEEQIARFAGLNSLIVSGTRSERLACYKKESFFYLMNYEQIRNDYEEIQAVLAPDLIILDEAQRVKNWQTKTAAAVKRIKTAYAFVLTGTPIENRIEELYSIMQVVDPKILGPFFKFNQDFHEMNDKGKVVKYKNLGVLQKRLEPVLLRRRKKDVEEHLPERTIKNYFVPMTEEQKIRYDEYSAKVSRLVHILKKRPLMLEESKRLQQYLACMRMLADTPYILDEECRDCPKLGEIEEILRTLMESADTKVIIFSEWERMLRLVRELADTLGIEYAWHTGTVPQQKRREDIKRFKEDGKCRLFLTTDSGSTGLNLQVANVVINVDLPWNPAKLEQRIARAWRKNQTRQVQVINLITENSIEHRMLSTLSMKQAVADAVLDALNVDTVDLPSASGKGLLEQLEKLTSLEVEAPLAPISPEHLMQELLARHSDRIHLVEEHKDVLVVVVDKIDAIFSEGITTSKPVEIIDLETYLTLQRLSAKGIIRFDSSGAKDLFRSTLIQNNGRPHRQEKFNEAVGRMKEAERKLKMASVLQAGGFVEESYEPANEGFKKACSVLTLLEYPLDDMALKLQQQGENIQNKELFVQTISTWMEGLSNRLAEFALGI